MLQLAKESAHRFCERFLGQNMMVLWEKEVAPGTGIYSGLSYNYIRVYTQSRKSLTNQFRQVRTARLNNKGLWGEVAGED